MNQELFDQARHYLPKYLSPTRRQELYDALKSYPDLPQFYLPPSATSEDLLQGDGWRGFVVLDFDSGSRKSVSGLIVSNSCDVDVANPRHLPRRILFSPLIPLVSYESMLHQAGLSPDQIAAIRDDIRRQRLTDIFHLPAGPYGPAESIVLLDNLHPQPLRGFSESSRTRLFRLHQAAFWVLLIKLSIHFCRLMEGVERFPEN